MHTFQLAFLYNHESRIYDVSSTILKCQFKKNQSWWYITKLYILTKACYIVNISILNTCLMHSKEDITISIRKVGCCFPQKRGKLDEIIEHEPWSAWDTIRYIRSKIFQNTFKHCRAEGPSSFKNRYVFLL